MNKKQWLVAIVLADFLVLNAVVVFQYGYLGFVEALLSTLPGIAVTVDLAIAISLIFVWMWNDAKARGISAVPYMVIGVFLGSVGPLAYLLRALGRPEPVTTTTPTRLTATAAAK
jgi:hypothetical protein